MVTMPSHTYFLSVQEQAHGSGTRAFSLVPRRYSIRLGTRLRGHAKEHVRGSLRGQEVKRGRNVLSQFIRGPQAGVMKAFLLLPVLSFLLLALLHGGCSSGKELSNDILKLPTIFSSSRSPSPSTLGFQYVTCGSVLKLYNVESKDRLHSHDVKYGSGSGQQVIVTASNLDGESFHHSHTLSGTCSLGVPCHWLCIIDVTMRPPCLNCSATSGPRQPARCPLHCARSSSRVAGVWHDLVLV